MVGGPKTITDGATCPFSPTAIQISARYPAENVDAENGDNGLMVLPQVLCADVSMPSLTRAGLHQRKGYHTPLFALAIEAEWRKRAVSVVPAQPKARLEGQRPALSKLLTSG